MTDLKAIKKNLQKTIGEIREDGKKFPKAMMTGQQMEKRTATVNCGGEFATKEKSLERAEKVMADKRFAAFLEECGASARLELVDRFDAWQIRITY